MLLDCLCLHMANDGKRKYSLRKEIWFCIWNLQDTVAERKLQNFHQVTLSLLWNHPLRRLCQHLRDKEQDGTFQKRWTIKQQSNNSATDAGVRNWIYGRWIASQLQQISGLIPKKSSCSTITTSPRRHALDTYRFQAATCCKNKPPGTGHLWLFSKCWPPNITCPHMSTYVHNSDDWLVPNSYTKKGKKAAVHTCFWNNPNQLHLAYKHYLWRQVPRQGSVQTEH